MSLFIAGIISCSKEKLPNQTGFNPPWAENYPALEVLWKTRLNPDSFLTSYDLVPVYHEGLILGKSYSNVGGKFAPFVFFDAETGDVVDTWNDYQESNFFQTTYTQRKVGDYLVLKSNTGISVINLNSRQTQWKGSLPNSFHPVYSHDDFIYTEVQLSPTRVAIWRSPVSEQRWEYVYDYTGSNEEPTFFGLSFGTLENGDQVMVWKGKDRLNYHQKTDLYAYNLSADSLIWKRSDLNYDMDENEMKIENERVFGLSAKHAFSLYLETGQTDWFVDIADIAARNATPYYENDHFHLNPGSMMITGTNGTLTLLSKATGNLRSFDSFKDDFAIGTYNPLVAKKGTLYLTDGSSLHLIDEFSGQLTASYKASDRVRISNKVSFDPNRDLIYFHDGYFLYCARIPSSVQ